MKLILLLAASLAGVTATSPPALCFTKSGKECVFPFEYQGSTYNSCTLRDTINNQAWCGTVSSVRFNKMNRVVIGDVGDCDFQNSNCLQPPVAEYCGVVSDCYADGNLCDPPPPGSSGCVCKNNQCKLSSGCGTPGLNWFNACSDCDADGCEDEGVCSFDYTPGGRGGCTGPETANEYCTVKSDCDSNPPPPGSSGWVCKNNQCKLSSGCGTAGLSWFNSCSDCDADGCEDEGVCSYEFLPGGGRCTGPETYPDADDTAFCSIAEDCYSNPPPPGSSGWVCKNNQCKLSSGCGTAGLNWFNSCSDCDADGCEDEGVCSYEFLPGGGRCTGPESYLDADATCVTVDQEPCIFPFSYKGTLYDKCTYVDSNTPWCATVPTVTLARNGQVSSPGQVADCDPGSSCQVEDDQSCTLDADCRKPGQLCDPTSGIQDVGCICRKGVCDISSGCGINGAFFFKSCDQCDSELDGCEDEGACQVARTRSGAKCVAK